MTDYEKRVKIKHDLGDIEEATNEKVDYCLLLAKKRILLRLNNAKITEVPDKYVGVQLELATRIFNRGGAEGEIKHDENGINRTYGTVNDEDILSEVIPYARLVF